MNIQPDTLKKLDELYTYILSDDYGNNLDNNSEKANRIVIGFEKDGNNGFTGNYIGKSIKTPLKMEVTLNWILSKIHTDAMYVNFSNQFKKLINYKGIDIYPTTYGIGVFVLFGNHNEAVQCITDKLTELGIKYTNEYSDACWVYRFKISKSQENIDLIKKITK